MRIILSPIIVIGAAIFLQITFISRITLLSGNADLVMIVLAAFALQEQVRYTWLWGFLAGLLVGGISATPWYIYLIVYLTTVGMARLLTRRIWQAPLLLMFGVLFVGNLLMSLLITFYRIIFENISLSIEDAFTLFSLPSMLLNILLAIAVYPIIRDIAKWIYPKEAAE